MAESWGPNAIGYTVANNGLIRRHSSVMPEGRWLMFWRLRAVLHV